MKRKRPYPNDEHEQDYADAAEARVCADRMAAGLACIVDPVRGDLDEVLKLKRMIRSMGMFT